MTKPKLVILIYSLGSGGAERVVATLIPYLKRYYDIELVLMNDTVFYDVDVKITWLEHSSPTEHPLIKLLKLPILAWKYKKLLTTKDISLSFMNRPNYINVLAKLLGAKAKIIVSERNMPSLQHNYRFGFISKWLIRLYNKADIVLANAKEISYDLQRNFAVRHVNVIYNPLIPKTCNKLPRRKFTFINIGRMDKGKNQELLIKAFNQLTFDARLVIVGDGVLREYLMSIASDNVEFVGTTKDIYHYLRQSDCFVFTSQHEGFPNVLLEALSCKLPVISTDCSSGPREILAPNTPFLPKTTSLEKTPYGILIKPNSLPHLIQAMNEIYHNYFTPSPPKEFDIETIVQQYREIIG
ncbi:MAG: glycosyltransferase [Epsilonproteobacteria bacterium]|nr:glycosyltransferase [Campylobacterota bacterium]